MDRATTNQGLKTGLLLLVMLAAAAIGGYKVVEYLSPVSSNIGYREFLLPEESTHTFAVLFDDLLQELQTQGFDVREESLSKTVASRFEYEIESAGGLDRLKCVEIERDTLKGFLIHWTESLDLSETTLRMGMIRYDLHGADGGDMHFRDYSAVDQILDETLEQP